MEEFIDCVDMIGKSAEESNIMVIGVGGGGGNAVKYMYDLGIHNVMFTICNTDSQALIKNPIPRKMQLGKDLTKGRGAGNKPERGCAAARESYEEISELLKSSGVEMVFITAGMGGGTGTGAAPVIAEIARELEILSVAIVTVPFRSEGPTRLYQAARGVEEIRKHVDALLIIDNESINSMYGDLSFTEAFGKSDDVLATAAKGIAEIITKSLIVNVDFADVKETMSNSGVALMGFATAKIGDDNIAALLTEEALKSPLLNQNDIYGAKKILVKVAWKDIELKMGAVYGIIDHIQAAAGSQASLIWGAGYDETVADGHASVVVIATGFEPEINRRDFENYISDIEGKERKPVTPVTTVEQNVATPPPVIVELDSENDKVQPKEPEDDFVVIGGTPLEYITPPQPSIQYNTKQQIPRIVTLDDEDDVNPKIDAKEEDEDMVVHSLNTNTTNKPSGSLFTEDDFVDNLKAQSDAIKQRVAQAIDSDQMAKSLLTPRQFSIEELEQLPAYIRRRVTIGKHRPEAKQRKITTFKTEDE